MSRRAVSNYRKNVNRRRKRKRKLISRLCLVIIVLAIMIVGLLKIKSFANDNKKQQETVENNVVDVAQEETEVETEEEKTFVYPTVSNSYVEITSDTVKSPYIALLDVEDNTVLAGRNSNTKIYPASMTKVMTLIVAVENLKNLDETFVFTNEIVDPLVKANASRAGFEAGEEVSATNLLYGLILPSGADAADALADMVAGSQEEFVILMNKKCEELGLKKTHFMNPSGLYDDNQYTTPIEMAIILEYAMTNETCAKVLSTYQYTTTATTLHPQGIPLSSTLFSRMYGNEVEGVTISSGKTGYTTEAGHCLVSYASKEGKHYVALTAGATNKWHVIYDDFELYRNYLPTTNTENETNE